MYKCSISYYNFLFLTVLLLFVTDSNYVLGKASNLMSFKMKQDKTKNVTKKIDIFNAKLETCNTKNCFPMFGLCLSSTTCHCVHGYVNAPHLSPSKIPCSYKQKKQMVAFFLEFFLPIGSGHFYIGHWRFGLLKLTMIGIIPFLLFLGMNIYMKGLASDTSTYKNLNYFISIILPISLVFIILTWNLIDSILFGVNFYQDNNGIPLKPW